jgi:hypothetical protein
MKCFGSATTFASVICIYGYSLTIFIPVVIACSVPIDLMQWFLIAYAVFHSTSLVLVNYWKELSKYMERKRYFLMAIIIICQAGLFLVLKLYFFEELNKQQEDLKNIIANVTHTNTTTKNITSTNSTLLF